MHFHLRSRAANKVKKVKMAAIMEPWKLRLVFATPTYDPRDNKPQAPLRKIGLQNGNLLNLQNNWKASKSLCRLRWPGLSIRLQSLLPLQARQNCPNQHLRREGFLASGFIFSHETMQKAGREGGRKVCVWGGGNGPFLNFLPAQPSLIGLSSSPALCSSRKPYTISDKWLCSLFLKASSDGAPTTSGGKQFLWLIVLMARKFLLNSTLLLSWISFHPKEEKEGGKEGWKEKEKERRKEGRKRKEGGKEDKGRKEWNGKEGR
ncbi:hypothetical protein L345_17406, partial [Ophiophagus hannah]